MTTFWDNIPQYSDDTRPASHPDDSLLIPELAGLYDAMDRLETCQVGFTIFAVDTNKRVTGVLTRGDVIRFLLKARPKTGQSIDELTVRHAMTPLDSPDEGPTMLYINADSDQAWYEQLTQLLEKNRSRWNRIKLLPVLNEEMRLVNVLDLESPRTRARLEALVMEKAFPFDDPENITNTAMERRRLAFDSIHYTTHRKKVAGFCELLLTKSGGHFAMLDAIFNYARADEVLLSLFRAEEWLKGHVSDADMRADARDALLKKVADARKELVGRYLKASKHKYFPQNSEADIYRNPQIIIILGCRGEDLLRERVSAAWQVMKEMDKPLVNPILMLSGGGDGHELSEARRMLKLLQNECEKHPESSLSEQQGCEDAYTLTVGRNAVDVVLEQDSRDTLGNAVFSWFTLRLHGCPYGLRATDTNRLERMVLVTDGIHAPRSYDIFRRVFAFRSTPARPSGPKIAVRTVERSMPADAELNIAFDYLRSESRVNAEIFRLVNLLTMGYDVIEDGHVRSILGQMLRLHDFYKGRWDLVRKYQLCWHEKDINGSTV